MHPEHKSKVYIDILKKIKEIINKNKLKPGDRLPSERELSETLKVGHSSVREALRAIELMGLIETRRGEGTFLADSHHHQLVETIGDFILQIETAQKDVAGTKKALETGCIIETISHGKQLDPDFWKNETSIDRDLFFENLLENLGNQLLLKIWRILSKFENSMPSAKMYVEKCHFIKLSEAINDREMERALEIYAEHFTPPSFTELR